jgi:GDP-mannose 6-dehydrogenase
MMSNSREVLIIEQKQRRSLRSPSLARSHQVARRGMGRDSALSGRIGVLCKAHGINGREVKDMLCQDNRLNISPVYLKLGFAFGGSCLPKGLHALLYKAKERDVDRPVLRATLASNETRFQPGVHLIKETGRRRMGVLHLSFKPGTDNVRKNPVVSLVERLIAKGDNVFICDEKVEFARLVGTNKAFLEREIQHMASSMYSSLEDLVEWAEVVIVAHGGKTFRRALLVIRENQTLINLAGIMTDDRAVRGAHEGI